MQSITLRLRTYAKQRLVRAIHELPLLGNTGFKLFLHHSQTKKIEAAQCAASIFLPNITIIPWRRFHASLLIIRHRDHRRILRIFLHGRYLGIISRRSHHIGLTNHR